MFCPLQNLLLSFQSGDFLEIVSRCKLVIKSPKSTLDSRWAKSRVPRQRIREHRIKWCLTLQKSPQYGHIRKELAILAPVHLIGVGRKTTLTCNVDITVIYIDKIEVPRTFLREAVVMITASQPLHCNSCFTFYLIYIHLLIMLK